MNENESEGRDVRYSRYALLSEYEVKELWDKIGSQHPSNDYDEGVREGKLKILEMINDKLVPGPNILQTLEQTYGRAADE